ncbi:ABC transporter ATP-binding protein [Facklamia sp. DSM 111018]|uniref:ABC transporter ATP-binding protein n=1 Tax=Facklamia lactis TaxID=2749967 RepID=A0ABS0LN23_9LACT|nr:ABC transporter ATP-binding protein [Facklamia lactis]MBG9979757.1 ABC transporter ATP-binding protein [Facklamia lactis]MBG9985563.1 ABC transporter ATP-binding protein [Facklamia lactis]
MENIIFDIKKVKKFFNEHKENELEVIKDLSLQVKENEFLCIVGPSGCGKSTLLRIMAGLESATSGEVIYRGKRHTKPTADIGMVFQSYSLMPWLNVEDNIGLGLKFKNIKENKKRAIVDEYLEIIGLEKFRKSAPHELSGGMQQRVAIARSLANNPDVILMDEPFGALDAYTRIQLQKELLRIWQGHKKTIVFITHSVDEAVYLADRIILLNKNGGEIAVNVDVNIERVRDRTNPKYVELNQKLLNALEDLNKPK